MTGEQNTVCKVRGITLNYSASQRVNFEKIRDMILNRDVKETVTVRTEKKIERKRDTAACTSSQRPKKRYIESRF